MEWFGNFSVACELGIVFDWTFALRRVHCPAFVVSTFLVFIGIVYASFY